jgi:hypothetical protein
MHTSLVGVPVPDAILLAQGLEESPEKNTNQEGSRKLVNTPLGQIAFRKVQATEFQPDP